MLSCTRWVRKVSKVLWFGIWTAAIQFAVPRERDLNSVKHRLYNRLCSSNNTTTKWNKYMHPQQELNCVCMAAGLCIDHSSSIEKHTSKIVPYETCSKKPVDSVMWTVGPKKKVKNRSSRGMVPDMAAAIKTLNNEHCRVVNIIGSGCACAREGGGWNCSESNLC